MRKTIRRGFTLAEVLVTVAVVAVVAAVVIPAVVRQITAGDPARVAQDLQAVRTGIENFYLNLRPQVPGDIEDLIRQPTVGGNDDDILGADYASGITTQWRGPYLEKSWTAVGEDSVAVAFTTGFSRSVKNDLQVCSFASNSFSGTACTTNTTNDPYVTAAVVGLSEDEFNLVNALIDGEGSTSTTGRLRWTASATFYLAYPYVTN